MDFLTEIKEIENILGESNQAAATKAAEEFEDKFPQMIEILEEQNALHSNFDTALSSMTQIIGATEDRNLKREFSKNVEKLQDGMEDFKYAVEDSQELPKEMMKDISESLESLDEEELNEVKLKTIWKVIKGLFKLGVVVVITLAIAKATGILWVGMGAAVAAAWIMNDTDNWKEGIRDYRDFYKRDMLRYTKLARGLHGKLSKANPNRRDIRDFDRSIKGIEKSRTNILGALNSFSDMIDDLENTKKYFKREDLKKKDPKKILKKEDELKLNDLLDEIKEI